MTFLSTYRKREPPRDIQPRWANAAEFAIARLGFTPDPQQHAILATPAKRTICASARQWGKSSMAAIMATYRAYTVPRSLILVLSPGARQSGEFIAKTEDFAAHLGFRLRGDGKNSLSLRFPNRSRIVGLPGVARTIRGFSKVSMLIVEEAQQVPDAPYYAIRPALGVTNGDLWLIGTPEGKRGFFYEEWAYGGDHWRRIAIPATECPRYSKEFLEEEREHRSDAFFRQEYLCEFVDDGNGVFTREQIESALDPTIPVLQL